MRLWLAKKLAPEVFREAEKFDYLRRRIEELRTWCGYEFPLIDKAVQWAQRSTRVHYMSSEEFNRIVDSGDGISIAVGDISRFREDLRRERNSLSTLTPGA